MLRRDPVSAGQQPRSHSILIVAVVAFLAGAVLSYQAGTKRAPRYEFKLSTSGIPMRLDTVTGKVEVVLPEPPAVK